MQNIKKSKILNKKAVEGIGTLIIFIAMILVAAVAAGVIIRTSSVLQEKAYVVGTEVRQNIITSMEIFSVTANGDVINHETRELIFSARVRAGSYPLQLATTSMTFTTSTFSFGANLQHPDVDNYYDYRNSRPFEEYELTGIDTSTTSIGDLNSDLAEEEIQIITDSGTGNDSLVMWLSGEEENITIDLGIDIDGASEASPVLADIDDLKIEDNNGRVWGFIQINGNITSDAELSGNNLEAFITEFQFNTVNQRCIFDNLIPERYYCSEVQIGDTDTILEAGEVVQLKYKLLPENAIDEDQQFQVKFIPKRGTITDMNIRTPDTIGTIKISLWP